MNSNLATRLDKYDAEGRVIALSPVQNPVTPRQTMPACDPSQPAILRQRFKLGPIDFDYRAFPRQRVVSLTSTDAMVHIVLPIVGNAVVVTNGETRRLAVGSALLLAAGHRTAAVCVAGSSILFLHIPRAVIQAAASRSFGDPRRLAAVDHAFPWSADELGATLPRPAVEGEPGSSSVEDVLLERRTPDSLISALRRDTAAEMLFPLARSVQRALDQIRANPQQNWTVHDLAQAAGVTPGTLRRNFRACLGVTMNQLVQQIRIEWVRSRVESSNESRSIGDIAIAAGFGTSRMMSRAYQHHFGETPSQTRSRAFRAMRD